MITVSMLYSIINRPLSSLNYLDDHRLGYLGKKLSGIRNTPNDHHTPLPMVLPNKQGLSIDLPGIA